jgi:phage/conjugal plasmid C-4 type zinc finger TraR family protein
MKGWGAQDDFQEQQKATIDDEVARARFALRGRGTRCCMNPDCGKVIPEARRKAMPNARYCVSCQEEFD